MALRDKYKALTDAATGIADLTIREVDGILYIDGTVADGATKDHLWEVYNQIDPNYTSGDLVLNVDVAIDAAVTHAKVITENSNLNIRKGPGTDQPIVGKAAHGEVITLVNRSNDLWWLVRTKDGEEGYCYAQYLEAQA
ncbi:SH3 domain-containing protein [Pedobacter roseus]|uniref:SH3 domain-containing protein n=1 Tax=Pedobacter roseus TaxID=336820 RepID=A0A7G9QGG6_9SPHI|nr:SH3 domain-containing protein [Pedobacter roseus]QNN42441.1 SH3 domain-containing protein [Pedobacter roseus]